MKRIYFLSSAMLLSAAGFSQSTPCYGKAFVASHKSFPHSMQTTRTVGSPDTTGVVNYTDFLPQYASVSGQSIIYGYSGGGYVFGNNNGGWNICGQGYQNITPTPVKIIGALVWFAKKERDLAGGAASKVVVSAYDMAANKACNTNGSGTLNTSTLNSPGPTGAAKSSADLLYDDIDTTDFTYVAFATPKSFAADFAIVVDATTLTAGDTVGIVCDNNGDAANLDYAFYKGTKWYCVDNLFSPAASPDLGSGTMDLDIALFAVLNDATGVNEYFNGMKLTTYPNPAVESATIEYTLEKNSNNVEVTVFDQSGRKVVEKAYGAQAAGTYKTNIETASLTEGTYLYQLKANGRNFTKQFVVAK